MMRSRWIAATAVLTLTAAAAAAPGDASPLAPIPASAPIVVHINGPDALQGHVAAFLNKTAPERAAAASAELELMFRGGEFGNGRQLAGLARDGHFFFAFFDADVFGPTPAMAILLPVAKYADFRQGFVLPDERKTSKLENGVESFMMNGQPTFLVDRKPYAVVASKKEVAEAFAKGGPGLDGKLSKDQSDRFLRSDLGVYLDAEALMKQYADPLKDAHKQINDGLDQAEKAAGDVQKAQFEALRGAADWLFQAAADGRSVLVAGELRADGAALHAEALLKPDGKTAAALKDVKPSAFRDLARLPAGQLSYAAWQTAPAVAKLLGPLQFGAAVAAQDSEGAKAVLEAVGRLTEAKPASHVHSTAVPPAGVDSWEFEDPKKAAAGLTELLGALRAGDYYLYGTLKDRPEVKPKVVRYRNMDMTYAHVVYDLEKMLADVPEPARRPMLAGLKRLIGDGVGFWFGTDGKTFVQATGKDWAAAKRLLDQYFTGDGAVGKDEAFAAVRKELPAEANAAVLIDAVQTAGAVLDYLRPLAESAGGAKLPVVKGKPAYAGAALTLRPERVDADVFVAADAVKQLAKPLEPYLQYILDF